MESLVHSTAASHATSAAAAGVLAVSPRECADALVVHLQALLDMATSTAAPKCWLATVAARLPAITMVIRLADTWLAQIELLQRRHPAQGRTQLLLGLRIRRVSSCRGASSNSAVTPAPPETSRSRRFARCVIAAGSATTAVQVRMISRVSYSGGDAAGSRGSMGTLQARDSRVSQPVAGDRRRRPQHHAMRQWALVGAASH